MAKDIIIYFSGARSGFMGMRLIPNDPETDDDIINEIDDIKGKNPITLTGWGGTHDRSGAAISQVIPFIIQQAPSDKLVVYGYSAGGMNALDLCRDLFSHRQARSLVDLLITVDAASGAASIDRRVFPNVAANLNFFTPSTTSGGDSHGAPTVAVSATKTRIISRPMPDEDHNTIRLASKNACLAAIRNILNGLPVM